MAIHKLSPDREAIEGQEVRLSPSDPVQADSQSVLDHLRELFQREKGKNRRRVRLVTSQATDEVEDPVVASALVQADEELAEIENHFAKELERRKLNPLPSATRANREHFTAESLIEALRDAAADGVEFTLDLDRETEF